MPDFEFVLAGASHETLAALHSALCKDYDREKTAIQSKGGTAYSDPWLRECLEMRCALRGMMEMASDAC